MRHHLISCLFICLLSSFADLQRVCNQVLGFSAIQAACGCKWLAMLRTSQYHHGRQKWPRSLLESSQLEEGRPDTVVYYGVCRFQEVLGTFDAGDRDAFRLLCGEQCVGHSCYSMLFKLIPLRKKSAKRSKTACWMGLFNIINFSQFSRRSLVGFSQNSHTFLENFSQDSHRFLKSF